MRSETLTGETLAYLLHWLGVEPEQAGARYELLRRKLCEFFTRNGAFPPEELADCTLDRVARLLAAGEVVRTTDHASYCLGVARNILHEHWRAPERRQEALAELPLYADFSAAARAQQQAEEQYEKERRLACLNECLARLPAAERELIASYYSDDGPDKEAQQRQRLARQLGVEMVALRSRIHRLRLKLERRMKSCVERREK